MSHQSHGCYVGKSYSTVCSFSIDSLTLSPRIMLLKNTRSTPYSSTVQGHGRSWARRVVNDYGMDIITMYSDTIVLGVCCYF